MDPRNAPAPVELDLKQAKSDFIEMYGAAVTSAFYLKIVVAILGLTLLASSAFNFTLLARSDRREFVVVRINDMGRPEATISSGPYEPREAEVKFFLIHFVQLHYARIRATVKDNFSQSLYFLDGQLADSIMTKVKSDKAIESVLIGESPETDVRITAVALQDFRKPPYRAIVDYEKIYYTPATRQETKRRKFTGNFVFSLKQDVPNEMIPINPLGFVITYLREDEKFE